MSWTLKSSSSCTREWLLMWFFKKKYDNEQSPEFSVYFGHECFTIFTAACYFNSIVGIPGNAKISKSGLKVVPVSIASNET